MVSEILSLFVCLQNSKIFPFRPWHNSSQGSKNKIGSNIHALEVVIKCIEIQFWWACLSGFGVIAPFACFQKQPKFPFEPQTIDQGVQKMNWLKQLMQVKVDLKHMQTNFGGCGLPVLEIMLLSVCLQKWPKFPFRKWLLSMGVKNRIGSKNLSKQMSM